MQLLEAILNHIDVVESDRSSLRVRGWIFHPTIPIERVSVFLGERAIATDITLTDRPDVQKHFQAYPFQQNALRSGFEFRAENAYPTVNSCDVLLSIRPFGVNGPLPTVYSLYCDIAYEHAHRPQPPTHLMQRIGGSENYTQVGISALGLILTCLGRLKTPTEIERVLDWGCGPGRVASQLAKCVDPARVHGCDIDPEAIEWARENLPGPHFDRVPPDPPTRYQSGFFDAVYGVSVMTHLDEPTHFRWLDELRRITRPGAALLLSVLSETMRKSRMPEHLQGEYDRKGFATFVPDYEKQLGFCTFSEQGYYKESFHSVEYIKREWSRYFSVEEYVKTYGQDMVLIRRRKD